MKRIVIFLLLMLFLTTGCAQKLDGDGMIGKTTYIQIDQEKAKEMMAVNDGHVVVDVRRADEYASGHIPGAILIPNESIGSYIADSDIMGGLLIDFLKREWPA